LHRLYALAVEELSYKLERILRRTCYGPTMILEVVASQDLWIRHSFFGLPGSLNDVNVLQ
jgi:hypothetical protein